MKKKNGKFFQALDFALPLLLGAAAIVIVLIFISLHFRSFIVGLFPVSVPDTSAVPQSAVSRPLAPALAQGSFTELFSGTGWMNSEKTNVYQDDKLSSISFPPDYEWEEINSPFSKGSTPEGGGISSNETIYGEQGRTIIAANGNGREVVLVTKSGKIFEFKNDTEQISEIRVNPLINSEVPRTSASIIKNAFLDYDDAKQTWVVAAVSENGEGFIGPIGGHISPISLGGSQSSIINNQSDLACANGECLLLSGAKIYRFNESNSQFAEVELPKEVQLPNIDSVSLGKAGNILLVGAVEKSGEGYAGNVFKYSGGSLIRVNPLLYIENSRISASMFSSPYPGTIRFGYDKENSEILVLYAAYIGQAKLFSSSIINDQSLRGNQSQPASLRAAGEAISNNQSSTDFSRFFPQRVMDGNITPKIFKHGNAWWLSSEINKSSIINNYSRPKFVRIEGGAGVDFADTLIRGKEFFELLPGFKSNELYALAANQDGAKIYKFIDKGYKKDKKLIWESLRLNRFDDEIISGRFYKIQGGEDDNASKMKVSENSRTDSRGFASIRFYLSNDGGKNWQEAKLNEKIDFQTKGNDFRFKVEINPDADVSQTPRESASTAKTIRVNPPLNFTTPWLNLISVEYYSKP